VRPNIASPSTSNNKQEPAPRRSTPAIIPETLITPTTTTLSSLPRQPAAPRSTQPVQPNRPVPVTGCDPGGCWDSGGNRYNSAAGNTYSNKAGKLCTRNGTWMQCF
jgi:hypothetical protein